MKRATTLEAMKFVDKELIIDSLGTRALRIILQEILPFSWHVYCKEHNLNPNIIMDDHEKRINRENKIKRKTKK